MERCPSVITPAMGMFSCWHTVAASASSGTRSFSVAPSRLRATSTSPEQQSRTTHNTSCPTSGRPPIESQNHLLLFRQSFLEPSGIGEMQRHQFFRAVELIGYCPLRQMETSPEQFFMDLGEAPKLAIAQRPNQRNHIQPKLSMWQSPSALFFWSCGLMETRTSLITAAIDVEGEPCDSLQRGDRSMAVVAHAHPASARPALRLHDIDRHLLDRRWPGA